MFTRATTTNHKIRGSSSSLPSVIIKRILSPQPFPFSRIPIQVYRSPLNPNIYLGNRPSYSIFISRPSLISSIWGSASATGIDNEKEEGITAEGEQDAYNKTISSTWNIPGLKAEVQRQIIRCHKKISKASNRVQMAQTTIHHLRTHPNVTQEELEACPNIVPYEDELVHLQKRLQKFNQLNESLQNVQISKHSKQEEEMLLPVDIAQVVIDLQCKDTPPTRPNRPSTKKEKGPSVHEVQRRRPYKRYYTFNQVEIRVRPQQEKRNKKIIIFLIRCNTIHEEKSLIIHILFIIKVGKQAEDNDELSCNPQHRDGADWWMHASGCPGSHVVIRCHDSTLQEEIIMDAAALAARQSKCTGPIIKVSLTRCRNVKKPIGAKAGLVQLSGSIQTIVVDMKKVQGRLQRLDATCLVN